jgi:formyl-CoA transferase
VRCRGAGPNDYLYLVIQPQVWAVLAAKIGRPELVDDPEYATPEKRLAHLWEIFELIEQWTLTKEKWEAFRELNEIGVPCGPVIDTRELLEDPGLEVTGMIVEVDHPERGKFKTVGCPFKLSDSPVEIVRSPLLGEHTGEVIDELFGEAARGQGDGTPGPPAESQAKGVA